MFVLPIILFLGIANAQSSEWQSDELQWSSLDTSATVLRNSTTYSDVFVIPEYMNVGEETNSIMSPAYTKTWKYPSTISFGIIVQEVGDSSNVVHTLQVSADSVEFYDWVAIDTSLSITVANEKYAMYEIITSVPQFRYGRVKSFFADTVTDSVQYSGDMSKSFTQ